MIIIYELSYAVFLPKVVQFQAHSVIVFCYWVDVHFIQSMLSFHFMKWSLCQHIFLISLEKVEKTNAYLTIYELHSRTIGRIQCQMQDKILMSSWMIWSKIQIESIISYFQHYVVSYHRKFFRELFDSRLISCNFKVPKLLLNAVFSSIALFILAFWNLQESSIS